MSKSTGQGYDRATHQRYEADGRDMPICETRGRPWLMGVNIETRRAVAFKPRCKQWSCPACAEINSRLWCARTIFGTETLINEGRDVYFLTLTSHEDLSPQGTIKVFPRAWKTLRTRIARQAGVWSYLMVPEKHKDGRLHAHFIETFGAGERWWKDNARQCGLGYMVDEQQISSAVAGFYVTKYLHKQTEEASWPKGFRHIRVSQNWPKLPEMETTPGWHWRVIPADLQLDEELARIQESGFNLQVLDHYTAWVYARAVSNEGEVD